MSLRVEICTYYHIELHMTRRGQIYITQFTDGSIFRDNICKCSHLFAKYHCNSQKFALDRTCTGLSCTVRDNPHEQEFLSLIYLKFFE